MWSALPAIFKARDHATLLSHACRPCACLYPACPLSSLCPPAHHHRPAPRCRREALAHPERAARPSFTQTRAARLHAACAACPPDVSAIRPRPKRARDAFGPGMVLVVNTVLAWLMFSIDVRNSMLR